MTTNILTEEQNECLEYILKGNSTAILSPAGTGKTFWAKVLIDKFINDRKEVGITALTGIAALNIGGTTVHSYLGLGLGLDDPDIIYNKTKSRSYLRKNWNCSLLIIDEISMMSLELFEKIEKLARLWTRSAKLFGGMRIVAIGDFFQLPPVKGEYCFNSPIWNKLFRKTFEFTHNFRQAGDQLFINILNEARLGKLSDESDLILQSRDNKEVSGVIPTKMFPLKRQTNQYNFKEFDKIRKGSDIYVYNMEVEKVTKDNKEFEKHYANFSAETRIPEKLELVKGCLVILSFNIDKELGLVNGLRGIVKDFVDDLPLVKFYDNQESIIDFVSCPFEVRTKLPEICVSGICNNSKHPCIQCREKTLKTIFIVHHIPLRLGYADTIHSSQGLTLDCISVDFTSIFGAGMAYVAISRCRSLGGLYLTNYDRSKIITDEAVIKFYEGYEDVPE